MRALIVEPGPKYSVDDVRNGIIAGLEAHGVICGSFNLGNRVSFFTEAELKRDDEYKRAFDYESACTLACGGILEESWRFAPDVVIVVSSFYVSPDTYLHLRRRGVHVVSWLTESPYEDERQIPIAGYADTVIVNDPKNIDEFRKVNPRTFYIPHAYNPAIHHDYNRSDTHEFSFVGTGYPSRVEFFEKVDWPCEPVFGGNWQDVADDSPLLPYLLDRRGDCMDNTQTADLYRASVTSANVYRLEAMRDDLSDGVAIGPREVELAMCGTFFARNPRLEGDVLFPMLPTFTEPGELADIIRWAIDNPDGRRDAVAQAKAAVADRTFKNHVAEVLRLIA